MLVTGLPPRVLKDVLMDIAPVGPSLGRDHQPVCDETPQIAMGVVAFRWRRNQVIRGGIPSSSNQAIWAKGSRCLMGCGRR